MNRTFSVAALLLSFLIALLITVVAWWAQRDGNRRREWLAAAAVAGVLLLLGVVDLLASTPRETPFTTVIFGATFPVLGALGLLRATRRVHAWIRLPLAYAVTLFLLYGGLLVGGTLVPRWFVF